MPRDLAAELRNDLGLLTFWEPELSSDAAHSVDGDPLARAKGLPVGPQEDRIRTRPRQVNPRTSARRPLHRPWDLHRSLAKAGLDPEELTVGSVGRPSTPFKGSTYGGSG